MANNTLSPTRTKSGKGVDWVRMITYLVLISGALISIFPFLATISISLMNLTEATSRTWLPSTPQWKNYLVAWKDADFSLFFLNSIKIALITLFGQIIFNVLAAYAFARMKFPGKNFLFGLMLATLTLPEADRKSTRLNSSHTDISRMPSSA